MIISFYSKSTPFPQECVFFLQKYTPCFSYLPLQGVDERVWVEEDWTIRETNLALSHTLQIFFSHARLTNCPEEIVKIFASW